MEKNAVWYQYGRSQGIQKSKNKKIVVQQIIDLSANKCRIEEYDENNKPKYAGMRGTEKYRYIGDAYGSHKSFPFRLVNKDNTNIHIFEGAIDLLSYATLLGCLASSTKRRSFAKASKDAKII